MLESITDTQSDLCSMQNLVHSLTNAMQHSNNTLQFYKDLSVCACACVCARTLCAIRSLSHLKCPYEKQLNQRALQIN